MRSVDLTLDLDGLRLEHPVLNGSGTFDAIAAQRAFGAALLDAFPFSAFVSKTITVQPRAGNPPPRIFETPSGMVNSIGLPNKGLDGFCEQDLPRLAGLSVPLIVSVMGTSHGEFARLVEGVGGHAEVAALELNVSCPNVESGLIVGQQPEETLSLVRALRSRTDKPLIVKLTPNVADPSVVALAAEQGGADAVSLVNTLEATGMTPATLEPWLGGGSGGMSGPGLRAFAVAQVRKVAAAVSIPVIGMGGIESGADALEFLAAGASAVAVGTANFRDPLVGNRVRGELEAGLADAGASSLSDLRGRILDRGGRALTSTST
jgi:dihydroorotate dehydrogenase (NAD+) catalytic subunit